ASRAPHDRNTTGVQHRHNQKGKSRDRRYRPRLPDCAGRRCSGRVGEGLRGHERERDGDQPPTPLCPVGVSTADHDAIPHGLRKNTAAPSETIRSRKYPLVTMPRIDMNRSVWMAFALRSVLFGVWSRTSRKTLSEIPNPM